MSKPTLDKGITSKKIILPKKIIMPKKTITSKVISEPRTKIAEWLNPLASRNKASIKSLGFGKDYCWEMVYGQKCIIK
ncbi:hypothetical protein [Prochlorococcus sp. MIT 1341]|uniref:hypothetical protein n=1 Tax=Prochlorococcus sp. MIT 1341 TaxID=3096221 RepID=UPI002A75E90F|nr:hypothetical protein [Prochlorococcus sp. MIT 1341]